MKKLLLLAVSLAFIASIGVGGTLAFRTYIIASHPSADQSTAPLAMQVSDGGTLEDFNFRAKGVQLLGGDDDASSTPGVPSAASISITQHTLQRDADGSLIKLPTSACIRPFRPYHPHPAAALPRLPKRQYPCQGRRLLEQCRRCGSRDQGFLSVYSRLRCRSRRLHPHDICLSKPCPRQRRVLHGQHLAELAGRSQARSL